MAPSDDHLQDRDIQREHHTPTNPFVSLKRYADEQFSALMNRAFGSNPFIINPAISYENFKRDYETWLKYSRDHEGHVQAENSDPPAKKEEAAGCWKCPSRWPTRLSQQEANDLDSFLDTASSHSSPANSNASNPCNRQHVDPRSQKLAIPFLYMVTSPYSPTNLERYTAEFGGKGIMLRAAFEDLIRLENGLPFLEDPHAASNSAESPRQRTRNMICSAIAQEESWRKQSKAGEPAQNHSTIQRASIEKPSLSETNDEAHGGMKNDDEPDDIMEFLDLAGLGTLRRLLIAADKIANGHHHGFLSTKDEDEENEYKEDEVVDEDEDELDDDVLECNEHDYNAEQKRTELDMISRALNLGSSSAAHETEFPRKANPGRENLGILSTLTTTQKTTLPDGSIETRIVLKKRFSDGREESTETQHMQHASAVANQSKKSEAQGGLLSKRGWFWN